MATRAHAEYDPASLGVRIAITRGDSRPRFVLQWEQFNYREIDPESAAESPRDSDWLRLPDEDVRALYEALADYFGHAGHDVRALRKDYDDERGRVDRLISHVIGRA